MKTNVTIERKDGKMTTESINALCAALLKEYTSNTALKTARPEIQSKFDLTASEWTTVLKEAKRLRAESLQKDLRTAAQTAFDFRTWLDAGFKILVKDSNFSKIYARWTSVKLKAENLETFVSEWYPFVQWDESRTSYELLKPQNVYFYRTDPDAPSIEEERRAQVFRTWDKDARDAATVLLKAFTEWSKALNMSVLEKPAPRNNERKTGTIYRVDVWDGTAGKFESAPGLLDAANIEDYKPLNYWKESGVELPHTRKQINE